MSEHDRPANPRRFLVRTVTLEPDGDRAIPVAVCPRRLSLLPVQECRACADFAGLCINPEHGAPFIRCTFTEAPFIQSAAMTESNPSACVADVMRPATNRTDLSATFDQALEAMNDREVIPVVDSRGRAVGLIGKTDILQRLYERARHEGARPEASMTVGDMILSPTFLVSPDAPVGQVAAILAYERLYAVLVVDSEQGLIGIVSALDLARWLACRSGYVVPAAREP